MFTPPEDPYSIPHNILFVEDLTERMVADFPELWKLGQHGSITSLPKLFQDLVIESVSLI